MIDKEYFYFKTKAGYEAKKAEIPNQALVFIEDTNIFITHGKEFIGQKFTIDAVSLKTLTTASTDADIKSVLTDTYTEHVLTVEDLLNIINGTSSLKDIDDSNNIQVEIGGLHKYKFMWFSKHSTDEYVSCNSVIIEANPTTKTYTCVENGQSKVIAYKDDLSNVNSSIDTLIKLHIISSFTANPLSIYKNTLTDIVFNASATFDGRPLNFTLTDDTGNSFNTTQSIVDTKQFHVNFNINNEDPKIVNTITKSVTVKAYYPIYYGASINTTPEVSNIAEFNRLSPKASVKGSTVSITLNTSSYIWIYVPNPIDESYGDASKVTSGGFTVPMNQPEDITIGRVTYKAYRTTNLVNAGTITLNIL